MQVYTATALTNTIGSSIAITTTQAHIALNLTAAMRPTPSLTATAGDWQLSDGVTSIDVTDITLLQGSSGTKGVTLLVNVASGLTQFRPYQLLADGTTNRLWVLNAEL